MSKPLLCAPQLPFHLGLSLTPLLGRVQFIGGETEAGGGEGKCLYSMLPGPYWDNCGEEGAGGFQSIPYASTSLSVDPICLHKGTPGFSRDNSYWRKVLMSCRDELHLPTPVLEGGLESREPSSRLGCWCLLAWFWVLAVCPGPAPR